MSDEKKVLYPALEAFRIDGHESWAIERPNGCRVADTLGADGSVVSEERDAKRLAACWNALREVANPAALPELLEAVAAQVNGTSVDWEDHAMNIRLAFEKLKGGA